MKSEDTASRENEVKCGLLYKRKESCKLKMSLLCSRHTTESGREHKCPEFETYFLKVLKKGLSRDNTVCLPSEIYVILLVFTRDCRQNIGNLY